MEEKKIVKEEDIIDQRLIWETPQLISLNKGKTEGGARAHTYEDTSSYYNAS